MKKLTLSAGIVLALLSSAVTAAPFGTNLFTGKFASEKFTATNPEYRIAIGDRVSLRIWGPVNYDGVVAVDAQGNIFVPHAGPVKVLGVANGRLQEVLREQTARTFTTNVGLYASLEAAQPVKVFVTGMVRSPGLYSGVSSDSVLRFLDLAGGVDPDKGSFIAVSVLRGDRMVKRLNLYDFLTAGDVGLTQLQDGDRVVVAPKKSNVEFSGAVLNPADFEFEGDSVKAADVLHLARAVSTATHATVTSRADGRLVSTYYPIAELADVTLRAGDSVVVSADAAPGTILVRVEGAHQGPRAIVLPYGSKMSDALKMLVPSVKSDLASVGLTRKSVQARQKEMLAATMQNLEALALNNSSKTSEEASLRAKEAELVLKYTEKAKLVSPKGQVVLAGDYADMLMEDGDVLVVPERSSVVMVHGDVAFPQALSASAGQTVQDFVALAGSTLKPVDGTRVLLVQTNGVVKGVSQTATVRPGEQIMVLPKVETKSLEVARGLTSLLYQAAVAAGVLLRL